ncbi:MAG: c-type cytochrome [Planctomycetaceae bacterium]|nr:c-type cytochrome [Planctomycetaceae bacterium]
MSLTPISFAKLSLAAVMVVLAAGCMDSGTESSFVYSTRTTDLIEEAQDGVDGHPGVKQMLDDRFGDPQHLRAWQKLPLRFGGTVGEVAEASEPGAVVKSLKLSFEDSSAVKQGSVMQLISTDGTSQTLTIEGWDAETGTAAFASALEHVPAAGDQVIVDGGQMLASGRGLYMRHCSHCHGTSGDGNGPTATYLVPRPRDYRNGIFKFKSTADLNKVSTEDLKRVLRLGIPGTYMPSFLLLKDGEIDALAEYVRFLAMRGEFEQKLTAEFGFSFSESAVEQSGSSSADVRAELLQFIQEDLPESLEFIGDDMAEQWSVADTEDAKIVPEIPRVEDTPESRRRGRELYLSKQLNCADCHGIWAEGNGPQSVAFEKNPVSGELYAEPGLHDIWDNLNQPRNLRSGIFRGGRRPIDIFARIHSGIPGSRMPSFKTTPHEDIWHVVNYVLSIQHDVEPGVTGTTAAAEAAAGAE